MSWWIYNKISLDIIASTIFLPIRGSYAICIINVNSLARYIMVSGIQMDSLQKKRKTFLWKGKKKKKIGKRKLQVVKFVENVQDILAKKKNKGFLYHLRALYTCCSYRVLHREKFRN